MPLVFVFRPAIFAFTTGAEVLLGRCWRVCPCAGLDASAHPRTTANKVNGLVIDLLIE